MKNNTIGKRIAEARINRNITQEHLEELSGLSVSTISRIETGKYMPTIENLLKLSEILDVGLQCGQLKPRTLIFQYFWAYILHFFTKIS